MAERMGVVAKVALAMFDGENASESYRQAKARAVIANGERDGATPQQAQEAGKE